MNEPVTKLIFLGSAQDGGVPQVGCNCDNCRSVSRTASSIALVNGKKAIIIDVTPDFRFQYRRLQNLIADVELKAVYLTHAHWGHYGGLMQLGKEGWNIQNLPVYLSQKFYNFLLSNDPFASLFSEGHLIPHVINGNSATDHGITPIPVDHRSEYSDTFAFAFNLNGKKSLYMPDVDHHSNELDDLIQTYDLTIMDATFYSGSELPHRNMSEIPHPLISGTIERFAHIAERIVLTHFNHSNPILDSNGTIAKKVSERGFRIADDGMILT